MYAHLMPESPTVEVGDYVQQGQVIGRLGNSGNTSNPHLHFQVMDGPSSLDANGLPFVFAHLDRIAVSTATVGQELDDFSAGIPIPFDYSKAKQFDNTFPLVLDLLNFQ